MTKLLIAVCGLGGVLLFTSCESKDPSSPNAPEPASGQAPQALGAIRLEVSFTPRTRTGVRAKPIAIQEIDRVTAFVSDSNNVEVVRTDLTFTANLDSATGRINVPAQDNLKVNVTS